MKIIVICPWEGGVNKICVKGKISKRQPFLFILDTHFLRVLPHGMKIKTRDNFLGETEKLQFFDKVSQGRKLVKSEKKISK